MNIENKRFKSLVKRRGLSNEEVADILEVTVGKTTMWINGLSRIPDKYLEKISSQFGVSIKWLRGEKNHMLNTDNVVGRDCRRELSIYFYPYEFDLWNALIHKEYRHKYIKDIMRKDLLGERGSQRKRKFRLFGGLR